MCVHMKAELTTGSVLFGQAVRYLQLVGRWPLLSAPACLLTSHKGWFSISLLQILSGFGCGPGGSKHQLESQKLQAKTFFFWFNIHSHLWVTTWRMFQYCWQEPVRAAWNKQSRVFGKAFSRKVHWACTLYWKFGQTGRIKTLKHQTWRECGTDCCGDSFVFLPHVFPSVGFCDYMWLPHSL